MSMSVSHKTVHLWFGMAWCGEDGVGHAVGECKVTVTTLFNCHETFNLRKSTGYWIPEFAQCPSALDLCT